VLLIAGGICLVTAVAYRSLPRLLRRLVATTSLGAIVLPTESDHQAALANLTKEA